MANVNHKDLTDPTLHEPKGAAAAAANEVYVADGAASGSFKRIPGSIVAVTTVSDATLASGSTAIIPFDDTIPLSSEGGEVFSTTHTAKSSTNKLHFHITAIIGTTRPYIAFSLFDGTTCIGAWSGSYNEAAYSNAHLGYVTYIPGDTSSHTYSLRCGTDNGQVWYFNGNASGLRMFGGKSTSYMSIFEEEI